MLKVGAYFQAAYKGQVRLQRDLILMEWRKTSLCEQTREDAGW